MIVEKVQNVQLVQEVASPFKISHNLLNLTNLLNILNKKRNPLQKFEEGRSHKAYDINNDTCRL